MEANFENLPEDEKLKADNDFLKMKMMLENGAQFGDMQGGNNSLDPAIENIFLRNVMAFEEKFAGERKVIKLFDKIGRPAQFVPVSKIPANDFETAWKELDDYLQMKNICLTALSPKVTAQELYRFTVEELFNEELDDFDLDGFTTNFTYDEFYPDIEYENTNAAVDDCITAILRTQPLEWMNNFKNKNLVLNNHLQLSEDEFKAKINSFKQAYDEIDIVEIAVTGFTVQENCSSVKGIYSCAAMVDKDTIQLSGDWEVAFERDTDLNYWNINNVQVAGINF